MRHDIIYVPADDVRGRPCPITGPVGEEEEGGTPHQGPRL